MKRKFNHLVALVALKTAKASAGAASLWNTFQPKEPAQLREIANK